MEELRPIVAANIIKLRTEAGMTQAELGELLNYSDKTISKWERADGLPDAVALKSMGKIFGVSVDDILNSHDQWVRPSAPDDSASGEVNKPAIIAVTIMGIITCAVMVFVILWLCGMVEWRVFVYALPFCLTAFLVLNSIFNHGQFNMLIIMLLILSIFITVFLVLLPMRPWQLFLIVIPAELVVFISFQIRKRKRK